jgi:hypothetical protein
MPSSRSDERNAKEHGNVPCTLTRSHGGQEETGALPHVFLDGDQGEEAVFLEGNIDNEHEIVSLHHFDLGISLCLRIYFWS